MGTMVAVVEDQVPVPLGMAWDRTYTMMARDE